jgi:YVTN family beta-propeller protein
VANGGGGTVSVIDIATNTVTATVEGVYLPTGIAVSPAGTRVYVVSEQTDTVSVIDTATNTVTDTVAVRDYACGIAVNLAGTRVYVTNEKADGSVSVIDTGTNAVTATVEVGDHPRGIVVVKIDDHAPDKPLLSSPTDGETDVSLTPELQTTEAFSDSDSGDTHAETEWQISIVEGDFSGSSLALSAKSDSYLTSFTVPEFILSVNAIYYWRVRFYNNHGAASEWSDAFSFTTMTSDESDSDEDGIPDDQEVVDWAVDLDDNGVPDMIQPDMKCVNTLVGDAQIAVKEGKKVESIESIESIDPDTIVDTENKPDEMPLGLISFRLEAHNPGDEVEVTIYLSGPAPSGAKWYKYDSINGWQDYSDHATFSADRTSVTLELKDGDYGDADGTANGFIVDPSGLGLVTEPAPTPTGDGGDGDSCFIATVAYGSPMEPNVKVWRYFRDRFLVTNSPGKCFLHLYYTYSPPVADFIARHDTPRLLVRWSLLPLVGVSWVALNLGPWVTLTLLALLLGLTVACAAFTLKRMRLRHLA